jgi:hypothetical protein
MGDEQDLSREFRARVEKKLDQLEQCVESVRGSVIRMEAQRFETVMATQDVRITKLETNWLRLFTVWSVIQVGAGVALAIFGAFKK